MTVCPLQFIKILKFKNPAIAEIESKERQISLYLHLQSIKQFGHNWVVAAASVFLLWKRQKENGVAYPITTY